MRVLQVIDTLNPGGAEQMAVLYANALSSKIEKSYLCCTRKEGILKMGLNEEVSFLYLRKKSTLDIKSILKLKKYVKNQKIDIIHAHSTSFFLATLIKILNPSVRLIWHDHYGNSDFLTERKSYILQLFSYCFDGVISVNTKLKVWATKKIYCKNIIQINNFCFSASKLNDANVKLYGDPNSTKIICVANLRPQKDHLTLIKAFEMIANNKNVSLHLIGGDPRTKYSKNILNYINKSLKRNSIFYYGAQTNISGFLKKGDIAVLSSVSEGLPVALLEYGMAKLAVVSCDVGQCREVLGGYGIIVESNSIKELSQALSYYYDNVDERNIDAFFFNDRITRLYSESAVINHILNFYQQTLSN